MRVVTSGFAAGLWPSDVGPVEVITSNLRPSVRVVEETPPMHGGPWSVLPSNLNPRIVPTDPGAPIPPVDISGFLERSADLVVSEQTKQYGPSAKTVFTNEAMLGLALDTYA